VAGSANHLSRPQNLAIHAAKILHRLLTFVKVRIARFCVDASGRTADSLVVGTWKTYALSLTGCCLRTQEIGPALFPQ